MHWLRSYSCNSIQVFSGTITQSLSRTANHLSLRWFAVRPPPGLSELVLVETLTWLRYHSRRTSASVFSIRGVNMKSHRSPKSWKSAINPFYFYLNVANAEMRSPIYTPLLATVQTYNIMLFCCEIQYKQERHIPRSVEGIYHILYMLALLSWVQKFPR